MTQDGVSSKVDADSAKPFLRWSGVGSSLTEVLAGGKGMSRKNCRFSVLLKTGDELVCLVFFLFFFQIIKALAMWLSLSLRGQV